MPSTDRSGKNTHIPDQAMNTRSRQRKKQLQDSDILSQNGSIVTPPESPINSASLESTIITDGNTRHTNGKKIPSKTESTPIKRRRGIYRVPIATWNFFVRKYEIPRKTLHVSIGTFIPLDI